MTRDELITWATRNGWKLDRWGHLKKEFDNGKLRDFMVTAMMAGDDEEPPADFLADAMKAMTKCLSDKELAGLGG